MKRLVSFLLFFAFLKISVFAGIIPVPNDAPALEGLIELHKLSAKAEKNALAKLNTSLGITKQIKKTVSDFREVRDILDARTNTAYSYLLLAARLAFITKGITTLTTTFTTFTASTTASLFQKPMCAWYYAEAVNSCTSEIKNLRTMMLRLGINELDLMRATMQEKLELLSTIQQTIEKCNRILENAYFWCSYIVQSGFNRLFLEDIFESNLTNDIAKRVISLYEV